MRGEVQGVFYRDSVRRRAEGCDVAGEAVNRGDGSVEMVLEGAADDVGAMIAFCTVGPQRARVDAVDVTEEAPRGLRGFTTA